MNHQPILNACGQPIADDDRHIPIKEAVVMCGCSRSTIDVLVQAHQFPPKHHITPGRVGFWKSEIDTWKKLGAFEWFNRFGQHHKKTQEQARARA